MNSNTLGMIALPLLIIGGINWGLVGLFDFNLVNAIFGGVEWLEDLIYILVGVSAIIVALSAMMRDNKTSR